jgi:hydroxyacylglutathione hydrolase
MRTPSRLIAPFVLAAACLTLNCPHEASAASTDAKDVPAPLGWFHVIRLDSSTFAISEPKYWQANVSYLLLGSRRALLFDTGPGIYSIRDVVRGLTSRPVTVIPSHLHFDHVGRIAEFSDIALIDLEALHEEVTNGVLMESPNQYLLQTEYHYPVSHWVKDEEVIDLGNRKVTILSTPGHTPESVSLMDSSRHRLFTGDLVNREVSLLNVPGSNLRQARQSLQRLIQAAPRGLAYEAHAEKPLTPADLRAIARGIDVILQNRARSKSICLGTVPALRYDVGAFPIVVPDASDQRLAPLASVTTPIEPLDERACRATASLNDGTTVASP